SDWSSDVCSSDLSIVDSRGRLYRLIAPPSCSCTARERRSWLSTMIVNRASEPGAAVLRSGASCAWTSESGGTTGSGGVAMPSSPVPALINGHRSTGTDDPCADEAGAARDRTEQCSPSPRPVASRTYVFVAVRQHCHAGTRPGSRHP